VKGIRDNENIKSIIFTDSETLVPKYSDYIWDYSAYRIWPTFGVPKIVGSNTNSQKIYLYF